MEPSAGTLTTPSFSDLEVITNLDIFFSRLCANTNKVSHGGNIYKHSVRSFLLQDFKKKFKKKIFPKKKKKKKKKK